MVKSTHALRLEPMAPSHCRGLRKPALARKSTLPNDGLRYRYQNAPETPLPTGRAWWVQTFIPDELHDVKEIRKTREPDHTKQYR